MSAPSDKRIYLDYAATAPFDERLIPVLQSASWANANSLYTEGQEAARQLREARSKIARLLGAHAPSEIIFTSGGSEANNMAIKGMVKLVPGANKTHVVVSAIEHHAVLHAADALKSQGFKIDKLEPSAQGIIEPAKLEAMLAGIIEAGDACSLVCVQAVNNELGTIQPIQELAQLAHTYKALFFCDAVQTLGKLEINLEASGVDACSFSGHKIGAPKGIGLLYLRRGTQIKPLIHGGGQESGMRSGTSNVPAACAFAQAIEYVTEQREQTWQEATQIKEHLLDGIAQINAAHAIKATLDASTNCVPHIVSLLVEGLEGETIVLRADNAGFAISSGSACSSASLDPSHVITALGIPRNKALGAIRLSFGNGITIEDIDSFLEKLPEVLR